MPELRRYGRYLNRTVLPVPEPTKNVVNNCRPLFPQAITPGLFQPLIEGRDRLRMAQHFLAQGLPRIG